MTSWLRCLLNIFESEHARCQKSLVELLARFLFKEKKAFSDLADLVLASSVQDRLFVTISPRSFIRSVPGICNIRPEDTYRRITKLSLKTTG